MTPERFRRVDQLLSLVLERPADERAEFIRVACAGEEDLRMEVESLLASQDNEDGFLAEAPDRLAAELLEEKAEQEIAKLSPAVPSEDGATEVRELIDNHRTMFGLPSFRVEVLEADMKNIKIATPREYVRHLLALRYQRSKSGKR